MPIGKTDEYPKEPLKEDANEKDGQLLKRGSFYFEWISLLYIYIESNFCDLSGQDGFPANILKGIV
jgi:hypothetical protein